MKQKCKWIWPVSLVLAVTVIGTMAFYRDAVRMVFYNLTVPTYDLDNSQDWNGGTTYMEIPYADVSPSDYLNPYVPDTKETPPPFVLIHGGGFISGDAETRQVQLTYRFFRDRGYACASVNYRLAQEAPFPAAVEDCKAAIRFLRAHADEYGYCADHIAVFGESAGGYLAVMCAVTNDGEFNNLPFVGQDKTNDVSAKVDVLVDYYSHLEKTGLNEDLHTLKLPKLIFQVANSWISGDVLNGYENIDSFWQRKNVSEMTPEELAVSDPYTYIEENLSVGSTLSVWIIHGDCDITVPYLQSERLNSRLTKLLEKNQVSYRLVSNMGHASDPLYSNEELELLEAFLIDKMFG